jgi:hypothetical protein
MSQEQIKVLQMIAEGIISAEEGERLLRVLEATDDVESGPNLMVPSDTEPEVGEPVPEPTTPQPTKPHWARFWLYPTVIGGVLALLGLRYTILAAGDTISGWWLLLTLPGLILGLLLFLLGWLIRYSYWLHLRIKDENTNIKISLPLPLSWIRWGIKIARPFVPKLAEVATDDVLDVMAETLLEDSFSVEVQEVDGEHVQIYYG